jgi:uncharacterized short protein YbdD (DUF466 family)
MPESRIKALWQGLCETARLMVGLPDYRRYVAHVAARHPGQAPMSEAEFVAERTRRRFEGGSMGRCC